MVQICINCDLTAEVVEVHSSNQVKGQTFAQQNTPLQVEVLQMIYSSEKY